jgi:hypothetical protein
VDPSPDGRYVADVSAGSRTASASAARLLPRRPLAAAWDTQALADGRYLVEVAASDVSGNRTVSRFPVRIANRAAV